MLQDQGVVNSVLVWLGLLADDGRLALINNQTGANLFTRGQVAGCDELDSFLARLFPTIGAGHWRGVDPRLHPCDWLLHHARDCGRAHRDVYFEPDCVPHLVVFELGSWRSLGGDPAWRRSDPLLGL